MLSGTIPHHNDFSFDVCFQVFDPPRVHNTMCFNKNIYIYIHIYVYTYNANNDIYKAQKYEATKTHREREREREREISSNYTSHHLQEIRLKIISRTFCNIIELYLGASSDNYVFESTLYVHKHQEGLVEKWSALGMGISSLSTVMDSTTIRGPPKAAHAL